VVYVGCGDCSAWRAVLKLLRVVLCGIIHALPPTRCYRMKAFLYRAAGLDVAPTARIVSSARFAGYMPVHVGNDTFIGHQVSFFGGTEASIFIGDCVDIAPNVLVVTGSHEIDMAGDHVAGRGYSRPVRIEDGCWIGAGVTILGGVTIGSKAVIGAGSVVAHDIPAQTIAVGNPARVIKRWDPVLRSWHRVEQGPDKEDADGTPETP